MKKRAKILYLSPVAERGGAETTLLQILKHQNRSLFEPVVGFLTAGPLIEEVAGLGVRTVLFPTTRFRHIPTTVRAIRSIRAFIRDESVDLVFGNMAMAHLYGGVAALGTATQRVWYQHGMPDYFSLVDLVAARIPSKLIFVYTNAVRIAEKRLHPGARIVPVRGGADLTRFDPSTVSKGDLRREIGVGDGDPVVACVARLQRWKGHSLFLQAAALVRSAFPRAHFLLVGGTLFGLEKEYAQKLEEEAAELLPRSNVHFLGHRSDLPRILADVDLLVHCPLGPEPFGLVILEAMAMEVPVVATREGGPEEIVVQGETGTLVPPRDASALANGIRHALTDPSRRRAMGIAARRRVQAHFSAQAVVRDLEDHLIKLVSKAWE